MNMSEMTERLKESPDLMLEILCATMKIEPESTTNKSKKRKDFMRRKRRNIGKKENTRKNLGGKGKVSPVQPSVPKKKIERNDSKAGSLLGADTIRKNAIKVLQLCEEPRKISR